MTSRQVICMATRPMTGARMPFTLICAPGMRRKPSGVADARHGCQHVARGDKGAAIAQALPGAQRDAPRESAQMLPGPGQGEAQNIAPRAVEGIAAIKGEARTGQISRLFGEGQQTGAVAERKADIRKGSPQGIWPLPGRHASVHA